MGLEWARLQHKGAEVEARSVNMCWERVQQGEGGEVPGYVVGDNYAL